MKKILLIFSIAAIFASCADESTADTINETAILKSGGLKEADVVALKSQLYAISQSEEWTGMKTTSYAYSQKMNFVHVDFADKKEFMDWVGKNLGNTQFASVSQAEGYFDNMSAKTQSVFTKYSAFFSNIKGATTPQLQIIFEPIATPNPGLTTNDVCEEWCMDGCDSSLNWLDQSYSLSMQGVTPSSLHGQMVQSMYWTNYQTIVDNLNNCISNCSD